MRHKELQQKSKDKMLKEDKEKTNWSLKEKWQKLKEREKNKKLEQEENGNKPRKEKEKYEESLKKLRINHLKLFTRVLHHSVALVVFHLDLLSVALVVPHLDLPKVHLDQDVKMGRLTWDIVATKALTKIPESFLNNI